MASVQYDDSAFYLLVLALLFMYLVPGKHLSGSFFKRQATLSCDGDSRIHWCTSWWYLHCHRLMHDVVT